MEENSNSSFSTENTASNTPTFDPSGAKPSLPVQDPIIWSAIEFVEHKKSFVWFLVFGLTLIAICVGVYFIIHSIFPLVMIGLIGITFGIIAGRSPRILDYGVSDTGVQVGSRFSSYSEFKSFSLIDEVNVGSVAFNPFKRFSFPTTIYFDKADEGKILNLLNNYLPAEQATNDPVDKLMRKLHF